jgi:hypothetical protein
VLWIAATSDGEVYTCNTQDDGYAGTLENKRKPNDAKELGREGPEYMPGQVGGQGQPVALTWHSVVRVL